MAWRRPSRALASNIYYSVASNYSFGSNATSIASISSGGAASSVSRSDHYHQGIATITASSSNTLDRPTFNLRAGSGVVFALSDSDGNGLLDTLTVTAQGASGSSGALEVTIDGGGAAITTGVKGDLEVPFACTITAARLFADQSGSIVIDIWRDSYANFPPTDADSITASAPPTLSSAAKSQDTTLTGWTTSLGAGDVLRFNVDSATTVRWCHAGKPNTCWPVSNSLKWSYSISPASKLLGRHLPKSYSGSFRYSTRRSSFIR